jgi:hypothetical protein
MLNWEIQSIMCILVLCLFVGAECHFQQYFSYIVTVSFIGGGNQRTMRKPTTCRRSEKLYHIMLYTSPWSRFELTSVVIGTDCISSCKSNYHTITAMTALLMCKSLTDIIYLVLNSTLWVLIQFNKFESLQWYINMLNTTFIEMKGLFYHLFY